MKEAVDEEIEDYYELIGVRKMAMNKKISKIIDLSGRLRFQKRWAQTPRIPETSVLGHMLIVAILGYFYSLFNKRQETNALKITSFVPFFMIFQKHSHVTSSLL